MVGAHELRKTLAQLLAESGNSNGKLKARFAWKSDAMANHYTLAPQQESNERIS